MLPERRFVAGCVHNEVMTKEEAEKKCKDDLNNLEPSTAEASGGSTRRTSHDL